MTIGLILSICLTSTSFFLAGGFRKDFVSQRELADSLQKEVKDLKGQLKDARDSIKFNEQRPEVFPRFAPRSRTIDGTWPRDSLKFRLETM